MDIDPKIEALLKTAMAPFALPDKPQLESELLAEALKSMRASADCELIELAKGTPTRILYKIPNLISQSD